MNTSTRRTHHPGAVPARRPVIARLIRATARRLSDRLHAAADDHARALGWQVTKTPGWLGLGGRTYRDPRFDIRRPDRQDAWASRDERP
jgi:hypothetical protein